MSNLKIQKIIRQVHFHIPHLGRNTVWIVIFWFAFTSAILAKENNWQLTLATGDTISSVQLQRIEGDSLAISSAFSDTTLNKWISVESIVELRKVKKSKLLKGAGIGLLVGTSVGALIGRASYEKPEPTPGKWNFDFGPEMNALAGGVLGASVGLVVGGIFGLSAGKDEVYDFSQLSYQQKRNMIGSLLSNQN